MPFDWQQPDDSISYVTSGSETTQSSRELPLELEVPVDDIIYQMYLVKPGQEFSLSVPENPSTGFALNWEFEEVADDDSVAG